MGILDTIRTRIQGFLQIRPAAERIFTLQDDLSFASNCQLNRIWYIGKSTLLSQFYRYTQYGIDDTLQQSFWGAVPANVDRVQKIHLGIPSLIVDTLSNIVVNDMQDVNFAENTPDDVLQTWQNIQTENRYKNLVLDAVRQTDVSGDGAWKISLDKGISDFPILEYYSGVDVSYTIQRGRITEVIFTLQDEKHNLTILETYGKGYITYVGYDTDSNKEVDLSGFEEYQPITWNQPIMLAVPMMFSKSPVFGGRGKSLFDDKRQQFSTLDEVWSGWADAVRASRVKTYVPEDLIPKDEKTGAMLMSPSPFNSFYAINAETDMAGDKKGQIDVVQPNINSDIFLERYTKALDACLMGVLSPATLGIELSKVSSKDSIEEREKVTLYSRQARIDTLQDVLPKVIVTALQANDIANRRNVGDYQAVCTWGDYSNPSFNSIVETVSKAMLSGIMSTERAVDELYSDSDLTPDEKAAEVVRIKAERGLDTINPNDSPDGQVGE